MVGSPRLRSLQFSLRLTIIALLILSQFFFYSSAEQSKEPYTLIKVIDPPEPHDSGFFGITIAMGGDRIVVGEYGASAAHIYDVEGTLIRTLKPASGDDNTRFGNSVAIIGNEIAVGEPDAIVNGISGAGVVCLYDVSGNLLRTLSSPAPTKGGGFGFSLATDGATLVVGEPGPFGGDQNMTTRVHLFDASGRLLKTFMRPQLGELGSYGWAVGIRGDLLVVSEPYVDYATDVGYTHGLVYLYNVTDSRLIKTLKSPRGSGFGNFGNALALGDDVLTIGEVRADANGTMMAGTTHLYALDGTLIRTLYPVAPRTYGYFGICLSVSESYVAVTQKGSVYLYDHHGTPAYTVTETLLTSAYFGLGVAVSGDRLASGANLASVGEEQNAGEVYLYKIKLPVGKPIDSLPQIGVLPAALLILLMAVFAALILGVGKPRH